VSHALPRKLTQCENLERTQSDQELSLSSFIGDVYVEDNIDGCVSFDDEDSDLDVTVGLSQVTIFPSSKLKRNDEWELPDSECLILATFGMCLDEDQVLHLASVYHDHQLCGGKKKKRPYVPPPVTWSQPVLIVPPKEEEELEDDSSRGSNSYSGNRGLSPVRNRKEVKFQTDCAESDTIEETSASLGFHQKTPGRMTSKASLMRMILLHGRVARALGIKSGDFVTVQLAGQAKLQIVKASVDDRASFNVVMEADWEDVLASSYSKTVHPSRKLPRTTQPTGLHRVKMTMVTEMEQESGDTDHSAKLMLTPVDESRQGILYFEAAMGVSNTAHGLIAGTGFCIYSCRDASLADLEDDDDSGDFVSRVKRGLPTNRTELVSSFRYLGRPFCPHHAEYSAVIEGLEWLFRFNFDKVYIVGDPDVVNTLRGRKFGKYNRRRGVYSFDDDYDRQDSLTNVPQLRRANIIAKEMIENAKERGVEVCFCPARGDDGWEAGELAEKAIDVGSNETHVLWENIVEATPVLPKNNSLLPTLSYSEDTTTKPEALVDFDADDFSLLKGEMVLDVLDEEFHTPGEEVEKKRKRGNDDGSADTEVTGHIYKPVSACAEIEVSVETSLKTRDLLKLREADAKETDRQQSEEKIGQECSSRAEGRTIWQGTEEPIYIEQEDNAKAASHPNWQDLKEESNIEQGRNSKAEGHPKCQDLNQAGRGTLRWKHLAKALRYRRRSSKQSSGGSVTSQSENGVDDDRSTWMDPPGVTMTTRMPGATINITQRVVPPSPLPPQSKFDADKIAQIIAPRQKPAQESSFDADFGDDRTGEEKIDYYYDGDDDETVGTSVYSMETKKNRSPKSKLSTSAYPEATMCYLLDLEFVKGYRALAEDVARLFKGESFSEEDNCRHNEDSTVATPIRANYKLGEVVPPPPPPPLPNKSLDTPQYTRSMLHSQHELEDPPSTTSWSPNYKKQYADV
jgi:ribonuclease HI